MGSNQQQPSLPDTEIAGEWRDGYENRGTPLLLLPPPLFNCVAHAVSLTNGRWEREGKFRPASPSHRPGAGRCLSLWGWEKGDERLRAKSAVSAIQSQHTNTKW